MSDGRDDLSFEWRITRKSDGFRAMAPAGFNSDAARVVMGDEGGISAQYIVEFRSSGSDWMEWHDTTENE